MKMPSPYLLLSLLLTIGVTLATTLQPRTANWGDRSHAGGMLQVLLGDGRRMFAQHFFIKADVYFHSGYYPSIFSQGNKKPDSSKHMVEDDPEHDDHKGETAEEHAKHADHKGETPEEHAKHSEKTHEEEMDFLGQSKDWIDRFGRKFYSSSHTHLESADEVGEILPWLKISADLDPQRVETYTVAAYWLRSRQHKTAEAEAFLREGLRANPDSYEILYQLGDIYAEDHKDPVRARNLWELALRRWKEQEKQDRKPDQLVYDQITTHLAEVEEQLGNLQQALHYRELEKEASPVPDVVQKHIDELKQKIASKSAPSIK